MEPTNDKEQLRKLPVEKYSKTYETYTTSEVILIPMFKPCSIQTSRCNTSDQTGPQLDGNPRANHQRKLETSGN
jgi:hypothetical protein